MIRRLVSPVVGVLAICGLAVGMSVPQSSDAHEPPTEDWGAVLAPEWGAFADEVGRQHYVAKVVLYSTMVRNAQLEAWYSYHYWKDVERWHTAVQRNEANRRAALAARVAVRVPRVSVRVSAQVGTGRCGGHLPPCSVMMCESGGNLRAENPSSSASGKWQIIDSTWGGYGGYSRASHAPESVQDERAAQIYAGGAGRSQWVC